MAAKTYLQQQRNLPRDWVDLRPAFLEWLEQYRPCETADVSPELHELATLVLECVEFVGENVFWDMTQLPLDSVRRDVGIPTPHAHAMLDALERIQGLMPGAAELFQRVRADTELFASFRRNRCRDLAQLILDQADPENILRDRQAGTSVGQVAKHLRQLDHDSFAKVLFRAGLITPNAPH